MEQDSAYTHVSFTHWTDCVTDEVLSSTTADDNEKSAILHAMKDFEFKTCIRFIPRATQRMYLSIEPRFGWVHY